MLYLPFSVDRFQPFQLYEHRVCVSTSDGTINRNRVSEVSGVFLESESEKIDMISHLTNDSSYLIVRILKV